MYYLPYNTNRKEFSRWLRKNSTLGEILLWQKLRAGNMMNYKVQPAKTSWRIHCRLLLQAPAFDNRSRWCAYHNDADQRVKDNERQKLLEQLDLNFLRFSDQQARKDMDWVLRAKRKYIVAFDNKRDSLRPC